MLYYQEYHGSQITFLHLPPFENLSFGVTNYIYLYNQSVHKNHKVTEFSCIFTYLE